MERNARVQAEDNRKLQQQNPNWPPSREGLPVYRPLYP